MGITDRENVQIISGTLNLSTAGFGKVLILGEHSRFLERTQEYAGSGAEILQGMKDAGFTAKDAEYIAMSNLLGMDLTPQAAMVGRRTVGIAQVDTITVDTATAEAIYTYGYKFPTGVAFEVKVTAPTGTPSLGDIRDLIRAAIDDSPLPVTTADSGADAYTVTSDFPGIGFTSTVDALQSIVNTTANTASAETVSDALDACLLENPGFYGVALLNPTKADVLELLTWCQTRRKLPMGLSSDADCITSATDDVLSAAQTLSRDGGIFWTDRFWEFPNVALHGNRLSVSADEQSTVYNNVPMPGITPANITSSERAFLEAKNGFFADNAGGITVTGEDCKASSGEWMDVLLGIDWTTTRLEEASFAAKVEASKGGGKIPMTNAGKAIFLGILRERFAKGLSTGLFTDQPEPIINAVDVRTMTSAERATRSLPTITFEFYLAGAINKTSYSGKLIA